MRARERCWPWIVLAAAAGVTVGCQATPPAYDAAVLSRETFTANHPGMVLGGPAAETAAEADITPWWYTRNDGRMNIREDGAAHQHEVTTVDVRDRQTVRPGRIHDTYRRTTRSRRSGQLLR